MNRRAFLSSLGVGTVAVTSGCVADGRVALDVSEEVTVEPLDGWWEELPDVEGNGALSLDIRADQRFDVYYFTSKAEFNRYKIYVYNTAPADAPTTDETATNGTATNGTATQTTDNATTDRRGTSVPTGHEEVSQAAVPRGGGDKYEVQVPNDGGRKSVETEGEHYLVVDHSNYGSGVQVERFQDPLRPFVDLKVIDEDSII